MGADGPRRGRRAVTDLDLAEFLADRIDDDIAEAGHDIAAFPAERQLAEAEAKRTILHRHLEHPDAPEWQEAVRILAGIYANHPDHP